MELPPDSLVRVLADLDLRDSPQDPIRGTAAAGSEITVVGGPREFEGGTWFEIRDVDGMPAWTRVDDASEVELVTAECPEATQEAMTMLAWDRLVCFGQVPGPAVEIVVSGQLSHCQGGVVEAEPEWLAYDCWVLTDPAGGSIDLHASPDSGIVFPEDMLEGDSVEARISGHLDDPAAESCVFHAESYADSPWLAPGTDEQIVLCREAFVVDEMEILP